MIIDKQMFFSHIELLLVFGCPEAQLSGSAIPHEKN